MPDVVGERLDVAKSEVEDVGYETEEIGGGVFGIVDESNWTVCETDPVAGSTGGGPVKLIVDRTCDETAGAEASSERPQSSAGAKSTTDEAARTERQQKARIRVPDVVGMDHQAAQNRMQSVGLFNLREVDGTGQDRMLLWDRNWIVVEQQPRPGARVGEGRAITLFSVKEDEL